MSRFKIYGIRLISGFYLYVVPMIESLRYNFTGMQDYYPEYFFVLVVQKNT